MNLQAMSIGRVHLRHLRLLRVLSGGRRTPRKAVEVEVRRRISRRTLLPFRVKITV